MLSANEKRSIRTGNGSSSEVVNNPSALLAAEQKSVFVQWSAEVKSARAILGRQGALREQLNSGLVSLPCRICDPFLCPEKVCFSIGKFHPSQNSFHFPKTI